MKRFTNEVKHFAFMLEFFTVVELYKAKSDSHHLTTSIVIDWQVDQYDNASSSRWSCDFPC
ncbi:hypothetical protein DICVIV_13537 [Dictyocaulus viviparus]|uniref:Uncharacterized protein n=1 Tax=Dictyocaulus viviparus TaxID=29172 RepID=A0A0D8X9Q8_DICVI|nr:hypothetical protein DICVIV_13537 [Dictyocaulus viviparus]